MAFALAVVATAALSACGGAEGGELDANAAPASAQAVTAAEQLASAEAEQVVADARALLTHRNQQLVPGTMTAAAELPQSFSETVKANAERDGAVLRARSALLAELGEQYAGFDTEVRLVDATRRGGKLVARIEETTRLDYARIVGDEPPYTAFQVEREFTFARKGGAWVLEDVQLANPEALPPINEAASAPAEALEAPGAPAISPSLASLDSAELAARAELEKGRSGEVGALAYYNYAAMADYAQRYALTYNPAYRSFPNDCTNFISQAMSAGGWPMVDGWYQSDGAWWYNWANQSYTWAGAHNWYFFATGSGRTYVLSSVWSMLLADVLQMDFGRDYHIDHTMIVTGVGSTDLYLSYHTTNTLNRSLRSIIAQYPSALYWSHRT